MTPWSLLPLVAAASLAPAADFFMYVGTYTGPESKGIYVYRFQPATGAVTSLGLAGESSNPSFLALHPSGNYLYSADETDQGTVSAFKIDRKTGKLALLNRVPSHGAAPCALEVDASGRNLFVANYTSGTVALYPIGTDGRLGQASFTEQHQGSGPNKGRQKGPHAHSANFAPGNRFALSSDLGVDKVFVYRFDAARHTLAPNTPAFGSVPPGSGPRHIAFHPNGKFAYAVNELNSTVTAFAWDANAGALNPLHTVSALPPDWHGPTDGAEVQVHPSGKFVYSSNRGSANNIATFRVDGKGQLEFAGVTPSGGKGPRYFGFDPTGAWLVAANQDSNRIVLFRIDPASGKLTPAGQGIEIPKPVCVKFLAAQ